MIGLYYSNPSKTLRVQMEGNREVQREVEDYSLSVGLKPIREDLLRERILQAYFRVRL